VRKAPCADLAELRSAYVDGALSDADRERLLAHLVGCATCRDDIEGLRAVRALLTSAREEPAPAAPDLSSRLVSIAGQEAHQPLWTRPFRRTAAPGGLVGLPSPRRVRRLKATAAVLVAGTMVIAFGLVGYAAAPSAELRVVADPTGRAKAAFSSSLRQFNLASDSLSAVMLADPTELVASPAARGRGPSLAFGPALDAGQARTTMQRAAEAADTVSYSGMQSFYAVRGRSAYAAVIELEARTGQGSQLRVRQWTGDQVLKGFAPAEFNSARLVDDDLLLLLERNYTLSGIGGAHVAGRTATMVAASRAGRVAARWWVDEATGLVLWQEIYDQQGAVELSFGFTTVTITPAAEMIDHLLPRLASTTATTSLTAASSSWLRASGWYCGSGVAGLDLVRLRSDDADDPHAIHLIYSDGLTTVGVYQERGLLGEPPEGSRWDDALQAYTFDGASAIATWQSGDVVFTVVTDGSAEVLDRAVGSLPHDGASTPTTMERVKEGWVTILAGLKG
jgi:anti-sigma factor RsiW